MTFFETLAFLAPLAVGFGLPAALALSDGKPARRQALAAGAVAGGVILLLAAASVAGRPGAVVPLALLVGSLALLTAGLHLLVVSLGMKPETGQVLCGLVVILLMGSVFLLVPVIKNAEEMGMPGAELYGRITLALAVNPFIVTGDSIFGMDLLRAPFFYDLEIADFQHGRPRWGQTALGYALAGALLLTASQGVRLLRRRFAARAP